MAKSVRDLFEEAMQLEPTERVALTGLLIESLDSETDKAAGETWIAEIDRRMKELDSGAVKSVPWEELRTRLYGGSLGSKDR